MLLRALSERPLPKQTYDNLLRTLKRVSVGPTSYARAVRADRKRAGLSLRAVAKRVGCSFTYLSKIENGHYVPSATTVEVIANVLGANKDSHLSALGWHMCLECGYAHRRGR